MSVAGPNDWRWVARDEQDDYCRRLGNRLFDEFSREKPEYLQTKVGFAMLGPPPSLEVRQPRPSDDNTDQCSLGALLWPEPNRKFIVDVTDFIVRCIDRLEPGTKDPLKVAFIFVTGNTIDKIAARYSEPVIRIHAGPGMGFVDTAGRHYKDWSDYLANNTLPPSDFMYPEGGIYRVDEFGMVVLGEGRTPAGLRKRRVLNAADQLGGWLGLGSAVAGIAGVAACPPLAVGAAALGVSTGIWAGIRSVAGLLDKGKHRQSISPLDSAARADWLMIAGGVVGIASSAAVAYVRFAASTGRTVTLAAKTATVAQGANITLSGLTAVDSGYRYFFKNGPREPLELLQLGVAVFFFTHSIVKFKTPAKLISESQDLSLRKYVSGLKGQQKKKMAASVNRASRSSDPISAKAVIIERNNVGGNFGHYLFAGVLPREGLRFAVGTQPVFEYLIKLKTAFGVKSLRDIVVNGARPMLAAQPLEIRILENAITILLRLAVDSFSESNLLRILKEMILKYDPRSPKNLYNIVNALITFVSYFILRAQEDVPLSQKLSVALESSFPEFLRLINELKQVFGNPRDCVVSFLSRLGNLDNRALEAALRMGRLSEEEAIMEADGDLVERCLAAGARLLACPSLSLSDMAHYRIGEEEAHFTLCEDRAADLGLAGFKVSFSEGGQIDSLTVEFPPIVRNTESLVKRLRC